jgi:peptide/nickel transport system substrate-binding protein
MNIVHRSRRAAWPASILLFTAVGTLLASGPDIGVGAAAEVHAANNTVVTFAEQPGVSPNYIFPETTSATQSIANNDQFINLLYPPLYSPAANQPEVDFANSIGNAPTWSANHTVATVTLKHYAWSDGTPVTAADVVFAINLAKAMGPTWGDYAGPTNFPYNLKSYAATNATTVRFVLSTPINPTFFVDNGLSEITPLPRQAWDKTSADAAVGTSDTTPAGAKAVLAFLQKQASNTSTYTTNPLWRVVDGPWTLKSFGGTSSPDIFVPNPKYSGTKPRVAEFEELPFTTDSAEFIALRAGSTQLDYGYIPSEDLPAARSISSEGYLVSKVPSWGFNFMIPNLKNPQVGPMLSQTYIRQVLAHLTDQSTIITHFLDGDGLPTYGPVPVYPKGNPFVSSAESKNPYPYSVSDAETLLRAHSWTIHAGGTDVCAKGGPSGCGVGIATGTKLAMTILYASGSQIIQDSVDLFRSDAAEAGVTITSRSGTFNTVIAQIQPCVLPKDRGTPQCNWQLTDFGGFTASTYPSGAGVFNTGGGFNVGQYSSSTLDGLIAQSTTASTLAPFYQYEDLVVHDEPWIWQPVADRVAATAHGLSGTGLTSEFDGLYGFIEPQNWSLNK